MRKHLFVISVLAAFVIALANGCSKEDNTSPADFDNEINEISEIDKTEQATEQESESLTESEASEIEEGESSHENDSTTEKEEQNDTELFDSEEEEFAETEIEPESEVKETESDSEIVSRCGAYHQVNEFPPSGYLIHFVAVGEHAHVWVNSQEGIAHIQRWLANQTEHLGIPGAPIELNNQYNPGYSYRMKPDEVHFGDMWIEVCDARPCYVEENATTWVNNPGTWCPWAFEPVDIWDCTGGNNCQLVYSVSK